MKEEEEYEERKEEGREEWNEVKDVSRWKREWSKRSIEGWRREDRGKEKCWHSRY